MIIMLLYDKNSRENDRNLNKLKEKANINENNLENKINNTSNKNNLITKFTYNKEYFINYPYYNLLIHGNLVNERKNENVLKKSNKINIVNNKIKKNNLYSINSPIIKHQIKFVIIMMI